MTLDTLRSSIQKMADRTEAEAKYYKTLGQTYIDDITNEYNYRVKNIKIKYKDDPDIMAMKLNEAEYEMEKKKNAVTMTVTKASGDAVQAVQAKSKSTSDRVNREAEEKAVQEAEEKIQSGKIANSITSLFRKS